MSYQYRDHAQSILDISSSSQILLAFYNTALSYMNLELVSMFMCIH